MKRIALSALVATFSISTFAIDYTWNAVSNVYDGMFTDPAHWSGNRKVYPGQPDAEESEFGNNAIFDFRGNSQDGLTSNIYFPDGVLTNFAGMTFRTTKDTVITVYGTNTTLVLPKPTNGTRGWGLGFKAIVGASTSSSLINFDFSGGYTANMAEPGVFSNFVIRATNPPRERKLNFASGMFDFHNCGYQVLFGKSVAVAEPANDTKDAIVEVGTNAIVNVASNFDMFCPSTNNVFRIFGTVNLESSIRMPGQLQNIGYDSPVRREMLIDVRKGGVLTYGKTSNRTLALGRNPGGKYGSSTSIVSRVSADGGTIMQDVHNFSTVSYGPGRHVLEFKNGSTGSFAGVVSLGTVSMSTGVVSIADSTVSFAKLLTLGGSGVGAVGAGALGEFSATASTVSFTGSLCLNNGSVVLGGGTDIILASDSRIYGYSAFGGTRTFAADGVSVSVGTAADPITGFDTATIGDGGLSIVADGDITLSQGFANASGENGVLRLRGAGAKTLSGVNSVSEIVVDGGSLSLGVPCTATIAATNGGQVAFNGYATAESPLGGLHLRAGSAVPGLALKPGETVYVDGDFSAVNAAQCSLSGSWATGDSAELRVAGTVDSGTAAAWRKLIVTDGLPVGAGWDVAIASDGGYTVLSLTVLADSSIPVVVDAGSDVHATNITYSAGTTLEATVAADASAEFSGNLGIGRFKKLGGGATTLSGANVFLSGIYAGGGLLAASIDGLGWSSDAASGITLADGTLEILGNGVYDGTLDINASSAANAMVIVKNDGDVTMPLPTATRGAFTKRGRGRLTFEVANNASWTGLAGTTIKDAAEGETLPADDTNGTSPATTYHYGGVNIAEGELVFRGTGESIPTLTLAASIGTYVGLPMLPAGDDFAQPGLVLDHVYYALAPAESSSTADFYMTLYKSAYSSAVTAPYLVITNGARLSCNYFSPTWRNKTNDVAASIYMDNGRIDAWRVFYGNELNVNTTAVTNTFTLKNGSAIYSLRNGTFNITGGRASFDVDNSRIAQNEEGDPIVVSSAEKTGIAGNFMFKNGSYFGCSRIKGAYDTKDYAYAPFAFSFDDSEWYVGEGVCDLPSCSNVNVSISVSGIGLKVNPQNGSTWRLYTKTTGSGGLVKGGAGTLVVDRQFKYRTYVEDDPVTMAWTGTTAVNGGTMRIENGAMADGARTFSLSGGATLDLQGMEATGFTIAFAGAATLANATLHGATIGIAYDEDAGTLATVALSDVAFTGSTTVDFGRDPGDPLPEMQDVVVGTWSGTKPDMSLWRGRNLGRNGLGATFVANDNGTITATISTRGSVLIVR